EVTGWPGELTAEDIEAVVVHSDIPRTGWFESSHEGVNQLISNSIWSQRGNFLAVPTDCPQRDERLGWTGDIAAYAATAAYQFDVSDFLHNWLLDVHAEASLPPLSFVPFVVPDILKLRAGGADPFSDGEPKEVPTAIWGDAAVWVAEALWNAYGDLDRLRAEYPGMVLHLESVERALSPSGLWDTGFQFGDWLDPDASPHDPEAAKADKGVVATACLIRSARFAAETARLIGEEADAGRWQDLADRTLAAFTEAYVGDDGRIRSDCATVYALAIAFDLLADGMREKAGQRLAQLVREAGYKVSTGFAGTPFVTWALSETGHIEDAYRLLLEEGNPSWLYPVTMGATTIWERWDSMLPDGSINPGEMTSFNHYALGAVADWIYQVVLGIRPGAPGYSEVRIQPVPGPGIDWVRGAHDSPAVRIEVQWQRAGDGAGSLQTTIPEGVPALLVLPDGTEHRVLGGTHRFWPRPGAQEPSRLLGFPRPVPIWLRPVCWTGGDTGADSLTGWSAHPDLQKAASAMKRQLPNPRELFELMQFKKPDLNARRRRLAAALTIGDLRRSRNAARRERPSTTPTVRPRASSHWPAPDRPSRTWSSTPACCGTSPRSTPAVTCSAPAPRCRWRSRPPDSPGS